MTQQADIYTEYGLGPNLSKLATHDPVLGRGPADPIAVIVGEAPGSTEVQTGEPFTGRAGQRLSTHLGEFRHSCWVTNILKYRPTVSQTSGCREVIKDRPPQIQEIAESMPYFWRELSLMAGHSTRAILALGRTAASSILQADVKISETHGHWFRHPVSDPGGEKWMVFVTYHPAAALRGPAVDDVLVEDLRVFVEDVRENGQRLLTMANAL
jgi:uracil-DNA glycosylase family 4